MATRGSRTQTFDAGYYRRFYYDRRTAVTHRAEMAKRAALIAAYVRYIDLPVRSVLDAGCGIGLLQRPLARLLPDAEYVGLEFSEYLCRRYGWQQGSLATWRPKREFDLAICYDVGQYLDDRTAAAAIVTLGRLCRGILYFTALTAHDWRHNCDQSRTDRDVYLRSADWYRRRLRRSFRQVGAGLWIRRNAPLTTWEMETL
jgi:SAM-dependent methyltransferase